MSKEIIIKAFNLENVKTIPAIPTLTSPLQVINQYQGVIPQETHNQFKGANRVSQLGTLVFSDLDISAVSYSKDGQNFDTKKINIDTVLFEVNQEKHIIRTAVQGRDGTVKEYISDGDYAVSIRGVITGRNGEYPQDAVRDFIEFLKAPVSVKVNSWFLGQFGITDIVVLNYSLSQAEGLQNSQPFQINAVSDTPFEVNLR
jgi:hypothetical protein